MKKVIKLLVLSLLAIGCNNEPEISNSVSENTLPGNSLQKSSNFENKLNLFAVNHINISDEIIDLIKQNTNADFSKISIEMLQVSNDENELKKSLENAGVINSDLLIDAYKRQIDNFNKYLGNDEDFLNLSIGERNNVVLSAINNNLSNIEYPSSISDKRTCFQQWDIDINRCNRNYYWSGAIAVIGTVATGGWGLLGVAAACIEYHDCLSDALDDYNDCKS